MNQPDPDSASRERVEELAYQCLDGLEAHGPEAVDEILADHEPRLQEQVRGMLAILWRVGLAHSDPAGSDPAALPERLGPYRLLECIGAGSMGVVYRAQREDDHAELALKLLQPGLLPIRGTRVRFRREIAALRELHHEGICPILDDGEIDGVPFLAMPFVPGESLRAHFARGPKGAQREARQWLLRILEKVAHALHHAHEHGFVHRDVKPANVLVRPDGEPVLLDFGLARLDQRGAAGSTLTAPGGLVGTPAYMAPEQVAGRSDVDRRCDVYALGAVLYEGLTGRCPHEAPTRESLYRRILGDEVVRPSRRVRDVPANLDVVCLTALERDPARRYRTARDFGEDLARVASGAAPAARLPGPLQRARRWVARNPLPSGLLLVLFLALGAVLLFATELRQSEQVARARALAADAREVLAGDSDVALHLALAAHELHPSRETWSAIQAALVAERAELSLRGHRGPVRCIEFSGDGERLVSGAADGTARIWELAAKGPSLVIPHGGDGVCAATFQPNGNLVATAGSTDGRICAWDARTGDRCFERSVQPPGGPVRVLRWSPDGRFLLSGGGDRNARVWTAAGELRWELPGCEGTFPNVGAWIDPQTVVTGEGLSATQAAPAPAYHLRVWRLQDGSVAPVLVRQRSNPHPAAIASIHLNPTNRHLALVVTREKLARIWDLELGEPVHDLDAEFKNPVAGGGWSADGSIVYTVAEAGAIAVWSSDGRNLRPGGQRSGPDRPASALANPRLPFFALCGSDTGNVLLMSYGRRYLRELGGRRLRGAPLAFSGDGNLLATTSWDHVIQVWRMWDPELPALLTGDRVYAAEWSAGGREVVTGSGMGANENDVSGRLRVWNLVTGDHEVQVADLQIIGLCPERNGERMLALHGRGKEGKVRALRRQAGIWQPDGDPWANEELEELPWSAQFIGDDRVLLCDSAGRVLLGDLGTRQILHRLPAATPSKDPDSLYRWWAAVCATRDGSVVWAGGTPGYLHRFDRVADGSYVEAEPLWLREAVRALKMLPDGSLLVGCSNGFLQRLLPGGERIPFRGHLSGVLDVDWTHLDGELVIASSDFAGSIRLWNLDGRMLREIVAHSARIRTVRFSPDGTQLLSASDDGSARIWLTRDKDVLALARRRVRPLTDEQNERLRQYLGR